MKSVDLIDAIKSEKEVFKNFSSFVSLSSKATLFYNSETSNVPHWNLVYPTKRNYIYTIDEVEKARAIFNQVGVAGHLLYDNSQYASQANEIAHYFYRDPHQSESSLPKEFEFLPQDVHVFTNIVAEVFTFDESAKKLFFQKMCHLSKIAGSRFFIVAIQGKPCGTLSSFQGTPGTHFLFNMAVLPQYRKMGVATALMNYAVDQIRGRIYGMTHNRVMQQSIAPQLNFKPLGTVYVVPINKNDYLEKSLYRDDP